jgi:hypothetical protein
MPKPKYGYPLTSPMNEGSEEEVEERKTALKKYFRTDDWEEVALGLARNHLHGFKLRNPPPATRGPKAEMTEDHLQIVFRMDELTGNTLFKSKSKRLSQPMAAKEVAFEMHGHRRASTVKHIQDVYKMHRRNDSKAERARARVTAQFGHHLLEAAKRSQADD